jgi:hypothetical protein
VPQAIEVRATPGPGKPWVTRAWSVTPRALAGRVSGKGYA